MVASQKTEGIFQTLGRVLQNVVTSVTGVFTTFAKEMGMSVRGFTKAIVAVVIAIVVMFFYFVSSLFGGGGSSGGGRYAAPVQYIQRPIPQSF